MVYIIQHVNIKMLFKTALYAFYCLLHKMFKNVFNGLLLYFLSNNLYVSVKY